MKNIHLFIILVFICLPTLAQNEFKGVVKDVKTNEPLPFVNIGVLNKGIGTVSDENGNFYLYIDSSKIGLNNVIQFSSVGYKSIKIKLADLKIGHNEYKKVVMEPDIFQLNEAVIVGKSTLRKVDEIIGYSYRSRKKLGYWKGDGSLGAELVTKIGVNKNARQLKQFYFHVVENYSDSVLVRVNVYKGGTKYPEIKLLKENLALIINKEYGKEVVDLTPYNVIVDDDFYIGLELLKVYGDKVGLVLAADDMPSTSYRRYVSQDIWNSFRGDAMTFYINTLPLRQDAQFIANRKNLDSKLESSIQLQPITADVNSNYKSISGVVFSENGPLANATVKIMGSKKQVKTDKNGRYNLLVKVGDELSFEYLEKQSIIRKVLEATFTINASL